MVNVNGSVELANPTSDADEVISYSEPYVVRVTLEGTCPILFHRWSDEEVAIKGAAAKGSKAKKTDNPETYVYRNDAGEICIPGEYLRGSIVNAAKFKQDPRSTRKSAMDLYKAGVAPLTLLASLGKAHWDFEDKRRVTIQRTSSITRVRPGFHAGWRATFELEVLTPEYIDQRTLHEVVVMAGRLVGLADYRPTYGRFSVVSWEVVALEG